ncbi:MAG: beta-glucosidase [Gammaproteobacteria bacterium]|nr:beta-glucosidase [Gammaproteobacteria bacterium]
MFNPRLLQTKIVMPERSRLNSSDFIFGVATSAFQIEGNIESREITIWDTFCRQQGRIIDNSTADRACDHIRLWEQDIEILQSLNVDAYRFSLSWARLIKSDGSLNHNGFTFYHNLLDKLNEVNIKPFVTFYHWDLPQFIQDKGGWLNRDTASLFSDYVEIVSRSFKNKIYSYATLNEPYCSAHLGYETGIHAPGITDKSCSKIVAHHLLLAHGLGMQVLNVTSPQSQNGIVLNVSPTYPATSDPEDIKATVIADQEINHWFLKPVLEGSYPELIDKLPKEYQPDIHEHDLKIISTPIDYLGINYYTRTVIQADDKKHYAVNTPSELPTTEMGWEIYPKGYTDILNRLNDEYQLPPVYLTENGAAMSDTLINGGVQDLERLQYYQEHLIAVHQAIEDGVDIRAYFAWSLMDNFEWAEGYTKRFGLVYIDYETQQRTIKQSGLTYGEFLNSRSSTKQKEQED